MGLSEDEVLKIIQIVESSSVEYLQLKLGDVQLTLSKQPLAAPAPLEETAPASPAAPPAAAPKAPAAPTAPEPAPPASAAPAAPAAEAPPEEGTFTVPAPISGVFYTAPEPGAAPFVAVGKDVDADTTVGLIEVMKVFNAVKADCKGKVTEILVADGAFVEHGQPIMRIKAAS